MNCQFVADHYGPRPSANPVDRIPGVFASKRKCPRLSAKVFQQIPYHARGLPVGVPGVDPPGWPLIPALHTRLILSKANLVTELKALKFSNRRIFFVFIDKIVDQYLCIRTDFHAVMRFTASRCSTDSIYPFKRFAFLLLFPKSEYCLSPFKKMRCFD